MEYIHFHSNLTIVLLLIQAALKETNYTSPLLQTLSMAVILRVETKYHFRQKNVRYAYHYDTDFRYDVDTINKLSPDLLLGLSTSRVIPTLGILVNTL